VEEVVEARRDQVDMAAHGDFREQKCRIIVAQICHKTSLWTSKLIKMEIQSLFKAVA
jgi:hypothetical protein